MSGTEWCGVEGTPQKVELTNDGDDFDRCKPELGLSEGPRPQEVDGNNDNTEYGDPEGILDYSAQ